MRRALICLGIGIYFGVVLIKSEVASWWRIQEMFHCASINMYGIIGIAVGVGLLTVELVRALKLSAFDGAPMDLARKPAQYKA